MPGVCTSRVETLMWNIPNPCSWQFITSSIGHDQMRRFMLVHAEILLEIPSHLHHETTCACWYFTPVITFQGWVVWHISASVLSYCVPGGTPFPCNTTISFWISVWVLTSQISFWWDNPRLTDVQYTWHEPWSQSRGGWPRHTSQSNYWFCHVMERTIIKSYWVSIQYEHFKKRA